MPTESEIVAGLRAGDSAVFAQVVKEWSPSMIRVARMYVGSDASAEEIAQEAWLAVVKSLDRFEGRSSLKTWVFRIVTNLARTRGVKENRAPLVALDGPTVEPSRFNDSGVWSKPPAAWPEQALLSAELRTVVSESVKRLPVAQRSVIELRDLHGFDSDEVCEFLMLTLANQRVLLHRGRAAIRLDLEKYFSESGRVG